MRKFVDPFLYNAPHLDIHGYDRYGAVALIRNFIDNMERIESKKIRIVHGHGEGILKEATHEYLKHVYLKMEYYIKMDLFFYTS